MAIFYFKFKRLDEYKNADPYKMTKEEYEVYGFRAFSYNLADEALVIASSESVARQLLNEKEGTTQYLDEEIWVCEELSGTENKIVTIFYFEYS